MTLSDTVDRRLRDIADKRRISLEAVLREAFALYIATGEQAAPGMHLGLCADPDALAVEFVSGQRVDPVLGGTRYEV